MANLLQVFLYNKLGSTLKELVHQNNFNISDQFMEYAAHPHSIVITVCDFSLDFPHAQYNTDIWAPS